MPPQIPSKPHAHTTNAVERRILPNLDAPEWNVTAITEAKREREIHLFLTQNESFILNCSKKERHILCAANSSVYMHTWGTEMTGKKKRKVGLAGFVRRSRNCLNPVCVGSHFGTDDFSLFGSPFSYEKWKGKGEIWHTWFLAVHAQEKHGLLPADIHSYYCIEKWDQSNNYFSMYIIDQHTATTYGARNE